jgi:hypothetical protein
VIQQNVPICNNFVTSERSHQLAVEGHPLHRLFRSLARNLQSCRYVGRLLWFAYPVECDRIIFEVWLRSSLARDTGTDSFSYRESAVVGSSAISFGVFMGAVSTAPIIYRLLIFIRHPPRPPP